MEVKFKKTHKKSVLPFRATPNSAGLDVIAVSAKRTKVYIEYDLGFAVEIPEGYVGLLYPRSSIADKELMLINSVGVIDSDYRGSVKMRFRYAPDESGYELGDRVGQLIIAPAPKIEVVEAEELSPSTRGSFGSTGK